LQRGQQTPSGQRSRSSNSRHFSSVENVVLISGSVMAEPRKPKSPIQRVPTRKLVASIKRDLRRMTPAESTQKPKKGKDVTANAETE
jgi:hypothetical protein